MAEKEVVEIDILKRLLEVGAEKPRKKVNMKRFGVDFELIAIGGKEINQVREEATFSTKKGKELDEELFNALIIQKGCVSPDWRAKELTNKFGDPASAIQGILLAGEMARLSSEILDLSGFNDEDEEQVKN